MMSGPQDPRIPDPGICGLGIPDLGISDPGIGAGTGSRRRMGKWRRAHWILLSGRMNTDAAIAAVNGWQ